MKKLIFLSLLAMTSQLHAQELKDYDQIQAHLEKGDVIHIKVDFSQCTSNGVRRLQSAPVAVYTPDAVQIANDNIATSLQHFTLDNPTYPGKAVYEFIRYTFTNDNVLTLTNQTLDATNYSPLGDPMTMVCKLRAGAQVFVY
jgi:hypothetical protein